jgi:hypothetical protein
MHARSFGALGALIIAIALVLVACGGGGTPTVSERPQPTAQATPAAEASMGGGIEGDLTPGTDLDACEIVTAADVKAATASTTDVASGTLEASPTTLSPGRTECRYEGEFGGILVALTPEDGANLYDAARGSYKDASDITGIGDGAFNSVDNDRAFIWKGKVTVMLTMSLAGDLQQLDVATKLGKAVVAKLG